VPTARGAAVVDPRGLRPRLAKRVVGAMALAQFTGREGVVRCEIRR
jgi:hypothetical protein